MDGWRGIALLAGVLLLACACAPYTRTAASPSPAPDVAEPQTTPVPKAQAHAADPRRLERLLAYAARSRSFTPERLKSEYAALRAAGGDGPDARIRLAILLAHPRAPFRDDARARRLLRQAARERTGVGDLARLLQREVDHRVGLERALARERARRVELQRKLEQLKTIEQEIERRTPAPVVPERQ